MDPLAQFNIISLVELPKLFGQKVDFTNSALYMFFAVATSLLIFGKSLFRPKIVPCGWQAVSEMFYEFIETMVVENSGLAGKQHLPLVLSAFMFVFSCNIVGMLPLPGSFTVTSHISVTFALSLFIFFYCNVVALMEQGWGFFRLFLPEGTPWWLAPMMILVELFAYFSRPVSLSIRLTANMVAGHTILKVIAGFVVSMSGVFSLLPFASVVLLVAFEIFIAILQAYIFAILVCVYLGDAVSSH